MPLQWALRYEVRSFEGPLEFYYPGQPDMTLVSGSVNVVRTSAMSIIFACSWELICRLADMPGVQH